MSNDLISRSAVIALIDKLGYVNCFNNKDYEYNSRVYKIRQNVVELPTVYDMDKVVEQLEADEKHTFDGCINKRYAIEIVKAGGVNG